MEVNCQLHNMSVCVCLCVCCVQMEECLYERKPDGKVVRRQVTLPLDMNQVWVECDQDGSHTLLGHSERYLLGAIFHTNDTGDLVSNLVSPEHTQPHTYTHTHTPLVSHARSLPCL